MAGGDERLFQGARTLPRMGQIGIHTVGHNTAVDAQHRFRHTLFPARQIVHVLQEFFEIRILRPVIAERTQRAVPFRSAQIINVESEIFHSING